MKFRLALVGVVAASLGVSAAIAAPPPGKGKPPTTGAGCKPKVTVVLKGTLAAPPTATSLSVSVTSGNRFARPYVPPATQPTSVLVTPQTKVRRNGAKTLADLLMGDRVLVQARACKAELLAQNVAPPQLTAVRVVAHPTKV